jgi:hypothetical protein
MAAVMIGVDPHKAPHTAAAIGPAGEPLGGIQVRAAALQAAQLLAWAAAWPERTWAAGGATGLGNLLAQQLVTAGEVVLDVQPKMAARVRLLASGNTNKNDPNDARSVAVAALRSPAPRRVAAEDHTAVLKVWSKRYRDLGRARTRLTQPGLLGPHQDYLRQRWDEGIHSSRRLHQELRDRGYRGSERTLRRLTAQLRHDTTVPAPPPAPAAKKVASWILTPPGKLTGDDRAALAQITARCQELTTTRDLVREFADMLCNQHGEHLEAWAGQAETSPVSELRGYAKGLRKDWAAVTAGLTTPHSSGAVEGHVNRIKMLKRQMYGRAKPDLLRKRVLLAD